jgi:hypothetical protein
MKSMVAPAAAVLVLSGCAFLDEEAKPAPSSAQTWYGVVNIFSDPPGVHIYYGGEYWGETGESQPVSRIWSNNARTGWGDLVLKKRGYKATNYHMVIRLDHSTKEEAQANPQKVVIVMDTE